MLSKRPQNPLALAVLSSLAHRPNHPYGIAASLRQRHVHDSVKLNYGSLYSVMESLTKRGFIVPREVEREGRFPERTVFEITREGLHEMHEWLCELIRAPVKEYPQFQAGLAFLVGLNPEEALALLEERVMSLQIDLAVRQAALQEVRKLEVARVFLLEIEYQDVLLKAELEFVRKLAEEIRNGTLDGLEAWREVRRNRLQNGEEGQ